MTEKRYKLICYIPETHIELVKNALFKAGCGQMGNYKHCGWSVLGTGQFKPLPAANPHIGQANKMSYVPEIRFETIIPAHVIKPAIKALHSSHPYEEPAYEIIALVDPELLI